LLKRERAAEPANKDEGIRYALGDINNLSTKSRAPDVSAGNHYP
jgi:hypothetical protein